LLGSDIEAEGSKELRVWGCKVGNKTHGVSGRRGRGYIGVGGRREECWIRGRFWERGERYNEGRERTMGTGER